MIKYDDIPLEILSIVCGSFHAVCIKVKNHKTDQRFYFKLMMVRHNFFLNVAKNNSISRLYMYYYYYSWSINSRYTWRYYSCWLFKRSCVVDSPKDCVWPPLASYGITPHKLALKVATPVIYLSFSGFVQWNMSVYSNTVD